MSDRDFALRAVALRLDREARSLVEMLGGAGVPALLLKGPVLQSWLYGEAFRPYGDIDLLVPEERYDAAIAALAMSGFVDPIPGATGLETSQHARALNGPDGLVVDLHHRLSGTTAPASEVWHALSSEAATVTLAGTQVPCVGRLGRLLVVVLHAAQHGISEAKPLEDLRRALRVSSDEDVRAASAMAERLGAAESFRAGMQCLPEGVTRFPEFGSEVQSLQVRARAAGVYTQPGVAGVTGMSEGSFLQRARVLGRAAWPSQDLLRTLVPRDRQQVRGWQARARVRRIGYQLRTLPSAVRALRDLRRG